MPMNAVAVAAGNINSLNQVTKKLDKANNLSLIFSQVAELGYYGYDAVVLGRGILDVRKLYSILNA